MKKIAKVEFCSHPHQNKMNLTKQFLLNKKRGCGKIKKLGLKETK